jgi:NitT/TauT family transport system ATP-binding protein
MSLELIQLSKTYTSRENGKEVEAFKNVNLKIEEGEFVSLIGPSGCGKTTLLRIISGLERPSRGRILIDGQDMREPWSQVGLVFQEFALFPWRTVRENIEFGLEMKRAPREERGVKAEEYISRFGLDGFKNRYPKELSGGMKQRVAIARTLINDPKIILMDEPFGALDSQTRLSQEEFLLNLWDRTKKTILFVTHNVDEALSLSQKVIVFSRRPGTVKKIFSIALDYPRNVNSDVFNGVRREILEYLTEEGM